MIGTALSKTAIFGANLIRHPPAKPRISHPRVLVITGTNLDCTAYWTTGLPLPNHFKGPGNWSFSACARDKQKDNQRDCIFQISLKRRPKIYDLEFAIIAAIKQAISQLFINFVTIANVSRFGRQLAFELASSGRPIAPRAPGPLLLNTPSLISPARPKS